MTDIGRVFLAKAWIFQAIVAGPTFVVLGMCAMFAMWDATYWTVYDFLTFSCTAIMAGGIIFLVLVQRQIPTAGKLWTFRFELAKSVLATGLWLWLMYVFTEPIFSDREKPANHDLTGPTPFGAQEGDMDLQTRNCGV